MTRCCEQFRAKQERVLGCAVAQLKRKLGGALCASFCLTYTNSMYLTNLTPLIMLYGKIMEILNIQGNVKNGTSSHPN
jgi:hypothetical protein